MAVVLSLTPSPESSSESEELEPDDEEDPLLDSEVPDLHKLLQIINS